MTTIMGDGTQAPKYPERSRVFEVGGREGEGKWQLEEGDPGEPLTSGTPFMTCMGMPVAYATIVVPPVLQGCFLQHYYLYSARLQGAQHRASSRLLSASPGNQKGNPPTLHNCLTG